jgi:hypothetical protein
MVVKGYKQRDNHTSITIIIIFKIRLIIPISMVGYGPFSLWVIHKEGLCPSSGDINRLMMMIPISK